MVGEVRVGMIHIGQGELVRVQRTGLRGLPTAFTWRGRRFEVREARRAMTAAGLRWEAALEGETYRLRTVNGLRCELQHDPGLGLWRMRRVLG